MTNDFLKKQIKGNVIPLLLVVVVLVGLVAAVVLSQKVSFRKSGAANGYAVIISYPVDADHDGAEPICTDTQEVKVTVQIVAPEGVTAILQREYYVAGDSGNPDRYLPSESVKNGDIKTYTYAWPGGKSGTETHAGFNLLNVATGYPLLSEGAGFDFFIPDNCPTPTATPVVTPTATPTTPASPTPTPTPLCNYLDIKINQLLVTPRIQATPMRPS